MLRSMPRASVGRLVFAELDRLTAWTLIGTGFVCIGIARAQLAAVRFTIDQIAYFTSGLGAGFFLLILGLALLISADLQDEKFKVDRLRERVGSGKGSATSAALRLGHPLRNPAVLIGLTGAVALVTLGWWRASSGASVDDALAGPLFATAGLLLSAGAVGVALRRERRQLGQWRRVLLEPFEEDDRATTAGAIAKDHPDGEWTLPGARRSHRRACQALAFPDAQPVPLPPGAEPLEPCLLCHTEDMTDE